MEKEYFNKASSSKKTGEILFERIEKVKPRLENLDNKESEYKSSPEKWSQKEIIGHLIDSAIINHQRFVRAQFKDDLVFEGYAQDNWIKVQNYNSINWNELVSLWYYMNLHLSRVMNSVPEEILNRKHHKHNLNEIAWKVVPSDQVTTLDYFMKDYVDHLEHHLGQIFRT